MLRKFRFFGTYGENLSGEMVLQNNSTCVTPKWYFCTVSFNPVQRMHSKTAGTFQVIVRRTLEHNPNMIHVLSTLVSLDKWIAVLAHAISKCKHTLAKF